MRKIGAGAGLPLARRRMRAISLKVSPSGARSISRRALPILLIPLSGCTGAQSALDPAGEEAAAVFQLFLVMVVGGALIWIAVVGLLIHAGGGAKRRGRRRRPGG
ncbi:hypothetical protein J2Y63_007086 [Shinella sp. BE166]|uniref:hypothetical protein n=1 Tax=Shinella sp. BE166 TaxID=3373918 RepID=UPI003EBD5CA6